MPEWSLPGENASSDLRAAQCAIGVDVGGTKIAAGIVSFPTAEVSQRRIIPTRPQRGAKVVLDDVVELARELATLARQAGQAPAAVGIALCELIDVAGRPASAHCMDWRGISLREHFQALAPAFLEADVRAAALAEAVFGAGRSFRQFVYVTIGTGISACLMIHGAPYTGTRGFTGTIASSPVTMPCDQCGHAVNATLEEIAAGPGLVTRFNASCPEACVDSAEAVVNRAARGDRRAIQVVQSAGEALGATIGLLVNTLDPEAIIIGGGLGGSGGLYWNSLVASTRKHIWSELQRDLPIVPAATGRDAGIIGAAAIALKRVAVA